MMDVIWGVNKYGIIELKEIANFIYNLLKYFNTLVSY